MSNLIVKGNNSQWELEGVIKNGMVTKNLYFVMDKNTDGSFGYDDSPEFLTNKKAAWKRAYELSGGMSKTVTGIKMIDKGAPIEMAQESLDDVDYRYEGLDVIGGYDVDDEGSYVDAIKWEA